MRTPSLLLVVAVAAALGPPAAAQPRITVLSKAEGLPSPYARALARTSDGALWVGLMAEQGVGKYVGLVRIQDGKVVSHLRGAAAGLRDDHVVAMAVDGRGTLWAATDKGLHKLASPERFAPAGLPVPIGALRAGPDGALWAVSPSESEVLRVDGGKVTRVPGDVVCGKVVALLPAREGGLLVCGGSVMTLSPARVKALSLHKSPLFIPRRRGVERRTPHIWLYGADRTVDGAAYLVGFHKKLVRYAGGRWKPLAKGHLSDVVAVGEKVVVSDFRGRVSLWDGKALRDLARFDRVSRMVGDSRGAVWLVVEDAKKGKVVRLSGAKPGAARQEWPLGRGSYISPGVIETLEDGRGGLLLSTNDGLWTLHR